MSAENILLGETNDRVTNIARSNFSHYFIGKSIEEESSIAILYKHETDWPYPSYHIVIFEKIVFFSFRLIVLALQTGYTICKASFSWTPWQRVPVIFFQRKHNITFNAKPMIQDMVDISFYFVNKKIYFFLAENMCFVN